jgi:hypothetical protein
MNQLAKLPPAFKRFHRIGGVLGFTVFDGAQGGDEEILEAMRLALPHSKRFEPELLRVLGFRRIDERRFYGDWYDRGSGQLLKLGDYATDDGRKLRNPKLVRLEGVKIMSGAAPVPDSGTGGEFAYAFANPPYPLRARPSEVQSLFDEISRFVLPPPHWNEILDWTSPRLTEVSDYFEAGMEWWGVFLFSIHVPALKRLTIVVGSTTD